MNIFNLNTQVVNDNLVFTKAYVDHFPKDNERFPRDLWIDFYGEAIDLVNKNQDFDFND